MHTSLFCSGDGAFQERPPPDTEEYSTHVWRSIPLPVGNPAFRPVFAEKPQPRRFRQGYSLRKKLIAHGACCRTLSFPAGL